MVGYIHTDRQTRQTDRQIDRHTGRRGLHHRWADALCLAFWFIIDHHHPTNHRTGAGKRETGNGNWASLVGGDWRLETPWLGSCWAVGRRVNRTRERFAKPARCHKITKAIWEVAGPRLFCSVDVALLVGVLIAQYW